MHFLCITGIKLEQFHISHLSSLTVASATASVAPPGDGGDARNLKNNHNVGTKRLNLKLDIEQYRSNNSFHRSNKPYHRSNKHIIGRYKRISPSFKTLDLVADQSSAENSMNSSEFRNQKFIKRNQWLTFSVGQQK